jgi:4-carboxymuconolactone decarboxylase
MTRDQRTTEVYERLFGPLETTTQQPDPELGEILRGVIFGDVFAVGDLDDRTRALVTVTVLATMQTLPQLRAHAAGALNVGVEPIELREAIYQLAPFIGFPRTLNAVDVVNEVLTQQGHTLPLSDQATVTEPGRYDRGHAIQHPLYGDEIRDGLAHLPDGLGDALARLLTESCFGDFYTRAGLTLQQRELLVLCALAALGGTDAQLVPHARANVAVGNTKATQLAALIHCYPYIGFPRAINAIRVVGGTADDAES